MTRPGALESKKRCHDLLHSDSERGIYQQKVRIFQKNLFLGINKLEINLQCCLKKKGILGNFRRHGKGKMLIGAKRGDNNLRKKEVIEVE